MFKGKRSASLLLLVMMLWVGAAAFAQGTGFTYQGKLADSGNPANGQYDLQFKLFDTATLGTGTQQGSTVTVTNVTAAAGIFTAQLDFGSCPTCFDGSVRFLEIAVRPNGGVSFTTLSPRQPLTSTPYAIKSINASQLEGQPASGFIQNSTTQQAGMTSFNIGGNGTIGGTLSAATVNASTQYSIAGLRVLTVNGPYNDGTTSFTASASNIFAGDGAGLNTTPNASLASSFGKFNSFFGSGAGQGNTTGFSNAFFGASAGFTNSTGSVNSFFGSFAGLSNTTGGDNAFFGFQAGFHNTTGGDNAFFGEFSGGDNTTGDSNAFFGFNAGGNNMTGGSNAFFGFFAGVNNRTGSNNAFFGNSADFTSSNSTGNSNTLLGFASKVTADLSNQTAIGARALVTQSNSLVLGAINSVNGATADTKVGIGTSAPGAVLDVQRDGGAIPEAVRFTTYGTDNEVLSRASGGTRASPTATPSSRNLLLLGGTGHDGTNFASGPGASVNLTASETWTSTAHGSRISFRTTANSSTSLLIRMTVTDDGNVGISTLSPADLLDVNGDIRVGDSGTNGCLKNNNGGTIVGTCASDARFKRDIISFPGLLDRLVQLRPVHFFWRADEYPKFHFGSQQEAGLIAQEVERILPELVTTDQQGFKAVNYSKLPLLTVQAVKELKAENDMLKQRMNEQQNEIVTLKKQVAQIESLKRVVCQSAPDADLCRQ